MKQFAFVLIVLLALVVSALAHAQLLLDFGDAPDPLYPTLLPNGARHIIVDDFHLGLAIDSELDGQPNATATGDDITPSLSDDDEEGVTFTTTLQAGQIAQIIVYASLPASTPGKLDAWVDFNNNGIWDPGEQIFNSVPLVVGNNNLSFMVPTTAAVGSTFARFRLSSSGGLTPQGLAQDGEVEDYQVDIQLPLLDFSDAPQPYPTLLPTGARHVIVDDYHLGQFIDAELDGQPNATATGDDIAGVPDDEDGVSFTTPLQAGQNAQVVVNATMPASMPGKLDAWVDFNNNGIWDAGEQIFTSLPLAIGNNTLNFAVPSTASVGSTYARFRLSTTGGLTPQGLAPNGEVEDYQVDIQAALLDFSDAAQPYPTLLPTGARHIIVTGFHLGQFIDAELDGQPNATATGDDIALAPDDEDGVTFTTTLQLGQIAQIVVNAAIPTGMNGRLDAWIDFDADGDWADPGEQIFIGSVLANGNNNLSFVVPATASVGSTFARFRLTDTTAAQTFWGLAPNGEVEDYFIRILDAPTAMDWGDAPDPSYPTVLPNGARHIIVTGFHLGQYIDGETNGQPDPNALGDDNNGIPDDEDGVTIAGIQVGQIAQIIVNAAIPTGMNGKLDTWIDFDHNGIWDAGEQIFSSTALINGNNNLSFMVPTNALVGGAFARFRLTDTGGQSPQGLAQNGEVEDYQFYIEPGQQQPMLDFSDAPDNPLMLNQYPTRLINNGARHTIIPNMMLGGAIDAESDGQPNPTATGDDIALVPDDEDGVFFNIIYTGCWAKVKVIATMPGMINAWMDFNHNGSWADPGDQIFTNKPVGVGVNWLAYPVPTTALTGPTFARFRYNTTGGLTFTGPATDGEVEDYQVQVLPKPIVVTKSGAKLLEIGTAVVLEKNIVTANFGINGWYFQESGRSAGIGVMVDPENPDPWYPGDLVSCVGATVLNGCELMIQEECSWKEGAGPLFKPLGQNNRTSGGETFGSQPGVIDVRESPTESRPGHGVNGIGLLVQIWGNCTHVEKDAGGVVVNAWLDDGSALWDGTLTPTQDNALGIKVHFDTPPLLSIAPGQYYVASGIMRTAADGNGDCRRCLWATDIVAP